MQYFILAFFIVLAFVFFYKIIMPVNEPDFTLKNQLTDAQLDFAVTDLARRSRQYSEKGKGLSLRLIKKYINRAYKNISKRISSGEECFEFENWIYDNYYVAAERMNAIKREIHKFSFLPHCGDLPRVYEFAQLLVKSCDGFVTGELLSKYVGVYNAETPFTFVEIMALKPALEFALLEYAAIFSSKSLLINSLSRKAAFDAAKNKIDLSLIRYNGYVYSLYNAGSAKTRRGLASLCLDNGADVSSRLDGFSLMTARYNGQMQSAVGTLFAVSEFMNAEYVMELSATHALLAGENGICYNETTLGTKYAYMKHIYRIARKKKVSELAATREIISEALRENKDISFCILPKVRSKRAAYPFIAAHIILTLGMSFSVPLLFGEYYIALSVISLPIFFIIGGMILSGVCKSLFSRRELPSCDLKRLDAESVSTLITTSRLIASADEVDDAFKNIETVVSANSDECFSYCLLFDLLAHKEESDEKKDFSVIEKCKERYAASVYKDRITVLLRKREKVDGKEVKYQGWEKKRGALIQLNRLIIENDESPFALILGKKPTAKYVITLDSDTLSNSCIALVELMEHPYNADTNVISVNMSSAPDEANDTLFSKFFRGATGLDSYQNYAADTEFDLFASGNYTGKGIYRVTGFHEKVSEAFRDNRILSHDYIEGAFAGCAQSRETALDTFPQNFSAFLTRQLRWLRGDWQLLPYLKRKVKNRAGEKVKNPISPIHKWHIFSNMVHSLAPVSSMLLLFFSLCMSVPAYICLLAFLLPKIYFLLSIRSSVLLSRNLWAEEFVRQTFNILVLPVTAFFNLYSITVTIFRLMSGKRLLEWKVFAHAKGRVSFVPNFITAIIFVATAAVYGKNLFFYVLGAAFVLGFFADLAMDKTCPRKKYVSPELNDKLKEIFYKTYSYFTEMLTPENNYLPCDNYQEFGNVGWIRRTSPTNIGYALIAHICAYEVGIVSLDECLDACGKIVSGVEKLPKWNGNLYNWYDIAALDVLSPPYVSAVDSGNFLSCLNVLSTYCGENAELFDRVKKLIDDTRIEKLFDEKRGLFRIGYNAETGAFDGNHYDLIGSEASLTYLTAIGLGRVKKYAWGNLSRRGVLYKNCRMFYSWTGGAFEHLMCPQFFAPLRGTDLYKSQRNVALSHVKYARSYGLPFWGISESQYGAVDGNGLYQYKAFGVPEISHANQSDVRVVSPYASIMALSLVPKLAHENIAAMENFGMVGKFGFYESADLGRNTVQQSYMTHHQGMILLSLCNRLHDNVVIKSARRLPCVRAAELLITQSVGIDGVRKLRMPKGRGQSGEKSVSVCGRHKTPYVNLLSGGKFALVCDENGNGYSMYGDKLLFRYNDRGDGEKLIAEADGREYNLLGGTFTANSDCCVYEKRVGDFAARTEISVLPSGIGSVRSTCLTNLSDASKEVTVKTLASLALNSKAADTAHPAYTNMFIETDFDYPCGVVTARRVNADEKFIVAYRIDCAGAEITYTSSRHNYYGRGTERPDFGRTLDPVFSGRFTVCLKPKETIGFSTYTYVGESMDEIENAVRLTRVSGYKERIRGNNFALAKSEGLDASTKKAAAQILFGAAGSVKSGEIRYGGRPIVALEVKNENSIERLKKRLIQLKKLYKFGIEFDLYIIYSEKHNYFLYISEWINETLDELSYRKYLNSGSSVMLINSTENERLARAVSDSAVNAGGADFSAIDVNEPQKPLFKPYPNAGLPVPPVIVKQLGIGGFTEDGSFFTDLSDCDTPAPWSNIIATETFGTIITESGGGYTYRGNSRENKISRWSNDAVLDEPSEFVALGEKGLIWSVTKKPIKSSGNYSVMHSFGYSEFVCDYNGIVAVQKVYISRNEDVKFYDITLKNAVSLNRKIDFMFALRPVLGDFGAYTASALSVTRRGDAVIIANAASGAEICLLCSEKISGYSPYKESFTDTDGRVTRITELKQDGSEPFVALTASVILPKDGEKRVIFAVSSSRDVEFADCDYILSNARRYYSSLSHIAPSEMNGIGALMKWLPYQTLCSRFFARAGFYQAGGAYGFRDQLQDCLTLLYVNPALVRKHILRCAAHQFEQGDVQHWWHPPAIGVRTTMCDDKLFLPYLTAQYISFTHDYEIISERVPYLQNLKMQAGEHSVYASCAPTSRTESLLEHCLKAIYCSLDYGDNGLIKMRGGDWNDAMDKVGARGTGTSVFMSMFLYFVIDKFLPYVSGGQERSKLVTEREKIKKAISAAWDGDRFIRAFTDDGRALGSVGSGECAMDLLVQSWAALSGIADRDKTLTALSTAYGKLVDKKLGIIKLLDPPFKEMRDVGYISDYPAGVRENGGQYTHAAVWYILALIKCGKINEAWELFNMINPAAHSETRDASMLYALEPYVMAADIYSGEHGGRGGWSWYTGAASWYYVCLVEGFLGLEISGHKLSVEPNLPQSVKDFSFDYNFEHGAVHVYIDNSETEGQWRACIGKIVYGSSEIELSKSIVGKKITFKRIK